MERNNERIIQQEGAHYHEIGGNEKRSGEARARVGGEVVQSDIHGSKEERKVEEDPGLQGSKRGSVEKALQEGFPGDSDGIPREERLDDHFGYIECMQTCQSGRAIQSLSVLQLSKSMLRLRRDAIWGKGCAQSFHEVNETGGIIYKRKVESEASNLSGRHSPHAPRQGCIEIDLTGDSPVPEKCGLDTVGREVEVGTRKERGVSEMVVEFRGDGCVTPGEEESAAAGGCANLDCIRKEKEETKDKRLSSTPREAELREVTTPTSELVDEAHAIHTEAGNSPRRLERNGDSQPNDAGRINTLENDPAREQTKESEENEQISRTNNICVKAGLGRKEGSFIAHSNTESIGEETKHSGPYNTNGTPPWRTEHGSRCTQPDGEKAGLCTEGGESRRDITNNRTENTRYNLRTDCAGALRKELETILSEREERERNARKRDCTSPSVPEKHRTDPEKEDEGSPEGTNDSDSASLAGADLDPATAAWAFDKDPGDLSGVHDTGSEDEKGRLEATPRRGNKRNSGEENTPGRDLFLTWGEDVGAKDIAAAILRNQKSERYTWRALRRFKQFQDRESMDDTEPFTTKDAKWIMAEFTETLSNTNLSSGVIHQTVRKVQDSINLFRETKIDRKDIKIFQKTNVGEKPRKGKRYKMMWDLTIITKWAKATYDSKDTRTLQRRAFILIMILGALRSD
ncbi:uncharacterized protein MONOS_6474 [Monocercomonoides exilis]|uniref:uncharacterized protein n=1 Tax=Monocercomonoides exilis TaxID=2049356 RepID=UPI00355A3253|nr:hypothetical protein MONOS_6474 [Monocercomonoides exilis]|eukprot:MONOS_6474.1-p1 / transcript=MONOS_6474.1 / gene=MONOS_6474 / organism=Monocercomonoides_exilis_PA203 / gene_product=unspecified product / transcript_product=unspecified product / location=Mono_scaffold00204:44120-46726(-) / protein_length=687 / sequence_SO=supercontig / SO=protein_coding / is_pseudo=false